jgi:hypothetical protein
LGGCRLIPAFGHAAWRTYSTVSFTEASVEYVAVADIVARSELHDLSTGHDVAVESHLQRSVRELVGQE